MSTAYRVVRLLKNRMYPTYQLHGYMANKKTDPRDGLRLGGLLTMDWLRQRLGEQVPPELAGMPEPSAYLEVGDAALPSLHINAGYLVDIVSQPEQGIWTLRMTEPDLGSDPGNPNQSRPAVPGRVVETNVGFRIVGSQLECGLRTVISEPEETSGQAEIYRLSLVHRLAECPDFGLRQLTRLTGRPCRLTTVGQLKELSGVWKSPENQLPCVIFTHIRQMPEPPRELPKLEALGGYRTALIPSIAPQPVPDLRPAESELPYDAEGFAQRVMTFCRSYILEDGLFERFSALVSVPVAHGDIVVLEPGCFGGAAYTLPWKASRSRREEELERLVTGMRAYSRDKQVSFGRIVFLSDVREGMIRRSEDAVRERRQENARWEARLRAVEEEYRQALEKKDGERAALAEQLERQRQYVERLEQEKEQLRRETAEELSRMKRTLADREEDIAYLKRKLSQPEDHSQIADWVRENFRNRLFLHPKAAALLEEKSARSVDAELICDALDFLATDYWERRYARITTEEMNSRCSEKYGRPFEVKPTGTTTIEFTPAQYKIKYFPGALGKPVESPLDYHLGVGCDPGNLLRIYFLHDDVKKLIVVGSLPRHLRAVTIR